MHLFEGWQDKFAPLADEIDAGMTMKDLIAKLEADYRIGVAMQTNRNVTKEEAHVITSGGFTTVRGKPTIRLVANQDLEYATVIRDVKGLKEILRHELSHYMQQNGKNPVPHHLTANPVDFNTNYAKYFLSPIERPAQALDTAMTIVDFDIDPKQLFSLFVKVYDGEGETVDEYSKSIESEVGQDLEDLASPEATSRDLMIIKNQIAAYVAMRKLAKEDGSKQQFSAYKRTILNQIKKANARKN